MGFLSEVHESRTYSFKDPALAKVWGGSGRSTTSGIVVTDALAMTCSAVYAAVNVLSSDIAKSPLNLHKRRKDAGSDHYTESKVYHLVKSEPNSEMGSMTFRQTLTAHALTLGGGYAEIERDGMGKPSALWPITPDRICAKRDEKTGRLYYLVDGKTEMLAENVLHIHGLGYDGTSGYALIDLARQVVGLALASEKFASSFFGNNASFGGIISLEGPRDPEELKEYRAAIEAAHKGADKAFRLLVLDNAAKFQQYQTTNSDSQLDELRDKQVEEVARFYRIPAHKLGNLKHATFSNIEQQDLEYYKGPILDWFTIWEQECLRKLVAPLERRIQFFKHNANVFLRGDIASRYTALGVARDKGIINANEWRDLEDMNPQDGAQGQQYLVQTAQMPADRIGEYTDAQIAKTKKEAEPDPPTPTPPPAPNDADTDRAIRAEAMLEEVRQRVEAEATARATAEGEAKVLREAVDATKAEVAAAEERLQLITADLASAGAERNAQKAARETAEAQLAEARTSFDAAVAKLVTGDTELAEAKRLEAEARELLHNLTVVESTLRSERDALAADKTALSESVELYRQEADGFETRARQLTERAELAEALVSAAQTDVITARADAEAARQLADEATAAANAATTDKAAAEATANEARTMATEAQARLSEADKALGEASAELVRANESLKTLTERAKETDNEVRSVVQASASVLAEKAAAEAVAAEARASAEQALARAAESDRLLGEARAAADEAKAETERAKAATAEARSTRNTDTDARTVAAHRQLVLMTIRDSIYVECERARRAQQTPQKLRQWIENWYDGHAERMYERLMPAVAVHLAWLGDDADAGDLTRALVMEHIAKSRQQLAGIADLEGDELAAGLAGLLRRWETERINEIPDRLMGREVAHVRNT